MSNEEDENEVVLHISFTVLFPLTLCDLQTNTINVIRIAMFTDNNIHSGSIAIVSRIMNLLFIIL